MKDDEFTEWIGCDNCGEWFHLGCVSEMDECLRGKSLTEIDV